MFRKLILVLCLLPTLAFAAATQVDITSSIPLTVKQGSLWDASINNFPTQFGVTQAGLWNVGQTSPFQVQQYGTWSVLTNPGLFYHNVTAPTGIGVIFPNPAIITVTAGVAPLSVTFTAVPVTINQEVGTLGAVSSTASIDSSASGTAAAQMMSGMGYYHDSQNDVWRRWSSSDAEPASTNIFPNSLAWAQYKASPTSASDGQATSVKSNPLGYLYVTTAPGDSLDIASTPSLQYQGVTIKASDIALPVTITAMTALPTGANTIGRVIMTGDIVSTSNSTTSTLFASQTFTGGSEDLFEFGAVTVMAYSDVGSAVGGLKVQFSEDGANWDYEEIATVQAGVGRALVFRPHGKYFRVQYVNGGSGQSTFRLNTIKKANNMLATEHITADANIVASIPFNVTITASDMAGAAALQVQGSSIFGAAPTGNPFWVNGLTGAGNLGAIRVTPGGLFPLGTPWTGVDGLPNSSLLLASDSDDNPAIPAVANMVFNGTSWDAMRGNTGGIQVTFAKQLFDAFGRLRTSEPFTVFESKSLEMDNTFVWSLSLAGGAVDTYELADSRHVMTVPASGGAYAIRQTKRRINYQPGKSQMFKITMDNFHSQTGVTKRAGTMLDAQSVTMPATSPYTPYSGIWFESTGDGVYATIMDGGAVLHSVEQADWLDPLDGTGPSGMTVDWSMSQLLTIDYEWLGVGTVRFGLQTGENQITYISSYTHANNATGVYMKSPNLPIRYEIRSDSGAGTFSAICVEVESEGGQEPLGRQGEVGLVTDESIAFGAGSADSWRMLVAFRYMPGMEGTEINLEKVSTILESTGSYKWALIMNPTIAGTVTYVDLTNTAVQIAKGAVANIVLDPSADANAYMLDGGFVAQQSSANAVRNSTIIKPGVTIDGVSDVIALIMMPFASSQTGAGTVFIRQVP